MSADNNSLAVGLGEIKTSRNANDVLVAYGLGSCVGVGVYDPQVKVAGLLHAVLPERLNGTEPASPKYVDSGLMGLISQVEKEGADRRRLIVWLTGGANMLTAPGFKQTLNIGERNVVAALAGLATLNLKIRAQEVGGHVGRTVRLYVSNGRFTMRALGSQERDL